MLLSEISVYALVALVSTAVANPTPSRELKQVSRAEVVRGIKRGVRPRAPVPSGAGGAPETVQPTGRTSDSYSRYFTGSGVILSANPSGEATSSPSLYATYANTVTTATAAQQCVDMAFQGAPGGTYYGAALWFDESDDLWHCRATYNENTVSDFTAVDDNARPVYGYNIATD